jgi:ribosomal protein S18 acetylase RimI-like enzyme
MDSAAAPTIRRATRADAPALAELGAATFVEAFGHLYTKQDLTAFLSGTHSVARYARLIEEPGVAIWLATIGEAAPIGYAVVGGCKLPVENLEPNAGEIRQLYVRANVQACGLGTRLLDTALAWLASQGRAPLYVGVWSENFGAQRLYARYGFEKIGEYRFAVGKQLDLEFILKQTTATAR